jgi:beta-galactosidase
MNRHSPSVATVCAGGKETGRFFTMDTSEKFTVGQHRADGLDLCFVTVSVTDKDGLIAPRANDRIQFTVEGPGEIVATDNGDPTSFESFQSPARKAFHGLCLVIIRGKASQPGDIKLTAAGGGLDGFTTTITSK